MRNLENQRKPQHTRSTDSLTSTIPRRIRNKLQLNNGTHLRKAPEILREEECIFTEKNTAELQVGCAGSPQIELQGALASLGKSVGRIPGCVAEVEPARLASGPGRWSVEGL